MAKKIFLLLFLVISLDVNAFGLRSSFFNCIPQSSRNLNRNGTLSSITSGIKNWDYLTSYSGVVDGNRGFVAGNMLASGGAENHNGFGFQLNYNRQVSLKMLYIFGYDQNVTATDYLIEYYDGSNWISLPTLSGTSIVARSGVFIFNPAGIKSANWRWSITNWGYPNTNYYIYEVEAFEDSCVRFSGF